MICREKYGPLETNCVEIKPISSRNQMANIFEFSATLEVHHVDVEKIIVILLHIVFKLLNFTYDKFKLC